MGEPVPALRLSPGVQEPVRPLDLWADPDPDADHPGGFIPEREDPFSSSPAQNANGVETGTSEVFQRHADQFQRPKPFRQSRPSACPRM